MMEPPTRHKVCVWIYRETSAGPRVLVLRRAPPWPREWHPVTGHVDPGESLEDAARREAIEETGCKPVAFEDLGYDYGFTGEYEGREYAYEEHAFAVRVNSDACTLSHEHEDYRWVPLDEAGPLLRFPEQREALRQLAREIGVPVPWDDE